MAPKQFGLTFAAAWPEKHGSLDQTLAHLNVDGLYMVDGLLPRPNWPDGLPNKVKDFIANMKARVDFAVLQTD